MCLTYKLLLYFEIVLNINIDFSSSTIHLCLQLSFCFCFALNFDYMLKVAYNQLDIFPIFWEPEGRNGGGKGC